jgi:predicted kinase
MKGKQCIILRGLPGSGKSTVAALFGNHVTVSLDEFWMTTDPETDELVYRFDRSRLKEAIEWSHQRFLDYAEQGETLIVVDNTHTQHREYQWWIEMAIQFEYDVHVLHVECLPHDLLRNTHGVPTQKLLEMKERWQPHWTYGQPDEPSPKS